MATKTQTSVLGELERLEAVSDDRRAEARAAHAEIDRWRDERLRAGLLVTTVPAEVEQSWVEARDRFHDADREMWAFKIENGTELLAEMVPDREEAGHAVAAAVAQLREALGAYTAAEGELLAGLQRLGIPGLDMLSDRQVQRLAEAIDPFDELDISPPRSRTLETPEGMLPLFRPNPDLTGWVR